MLPRCSLAGLALLLALPAHADAPSAPDVAAQISPAGLRFVAQEVPRYLPSVFHAPGFTSQLVDCPFTDHDTDLTVSNMTTGVTISDLSITPTTDRLTVRIVARASGLASLRVTRPYACVGYPLECRAGFQIARAVATGRFSPTLQGGAVKLRDPDVELQLTKQDLTIEVSDCGFVGTLLNLVLPLFKGYIVDQATSELEGLVRDQVPPRVEALLSGMTRASGQVPGFTVQGSLTSVTTRSRGVQVGARIDIEPDAQAACPLPAAPPPPLSGAPAPGSHAEHVGLALSRAALAKAVLALWRGGGLCATTAQLRDMGLPHELPGWGAFLLGLSGSAGLSLHTHTAPRLELLPGQGAQVRAILDGVRLVIDGSGPNGPTSVTATATVSAEAGARIDPESRAVVLDVRAVQISDLALSATDPTGLRLQPALARTLVQGLVAPLVEQQLSGRALGPQVLHESGGLLDPYYLDLTRGVTDAEHVYLYASVFRRPDWDVTPPQTSLAPGGAVAAHLRLVATGQDSGTPSGLLRYRWRVDGGAWSAASFAPSHSATLAPGPHVIEVVALDLNGNVDPSPARLELDVDPTGKGDLLGGGVAEELGGCSLTRRPGGPGLWLVLVALLLLRRGNAAARERPPCQPGARARATTKGSSSICSSSGAPNPAARTRPWSCSWSRPWPATKRRKYQASSGRVPGRTWRQ